MSKVILMTIVMLMLSVMIVVAEEKPANGKDLCLFEVRYCPGGEEYNIAEKYDRLKEAVAKGLTLYTPGELVHLKKSMKAAEEIMQLLGLGCH